MKWLYQGKNFLYFMMAILLGVSVFIAWLLFRTPDATPEQEQRYAASSETDVPQPTATFNGTPMNFARFILPGTSTPTSIPTATPIVPVFRDGNYTVGVAEMQIRETVTCGSTVFSNQGNTLTVSNLRGMTFSVTVAQHGNLDENNDGWIAVDNAGNFGIGHDAGGWHTDWIGGCH